MRGDRRHKRLNAHLLKQIADIRARNDRLLKLRTTGVGYWLRAFAGEAMSREEEQLDRLRGRGMHGGAC